MLLSSWLQNIWFRRIFIFIFLGTIILELLQLTYWREQPTNLISPVIWLLSGCLTVLLGWALAVYTSRQKLIPITPSSYNWKTIAKWVFFFAGAAIGITILSAVYKEIPEVNNLSDILPAKREYVRRLLNGEVVYRPVQFESYVLEPTFLPLRWLPFVFAGLGGIDYRWMSFALLALGLAVWNIRFPKGDYSYVEILIKCILPFCCLLFFAKTDNISLAVTVELLIVGYYLIFTRFFFSKNPIVAALVITICLLSRYSFLLWLPLLFLVYWQEYKFKYVIRTAGFILFGILAFYFIPFCLHDNGAHFLKASQYYLNACFGTWHPDAWRPVGALPYIHSRGIGFSAWFLIKAPGELRQRFDLMLQIALLIQVLTTLLLSVFYWYKVRGKSQYEIYVFLLVSLKLFMMIFNGFLIAPFSYLFELSFYLSFPLLFMLPLKALWKTH